jgi:BirA family biotin operon repressor/biotin-[acetyl-CoA-carboxylase] ligase
MCQSTNAMAIQIATEQPELTPFALSTDHQLAGKGQQGSTWEAEPGQNLTFTLAVDGNGNQANLQAFWNMHLSNCLTNWLNASILSPLIFKIKWPNDLYAGQKKLAGLLIQNQLSGYHIETSFVGIGLNVNQTVFRWPQAVSLKMITGRQFSTELLLQSCLQHFQPYMPDLQRQSAAIKSEYLKNMYLFQQKHWFTTPEGEKFAGRIVDVDPQGKLLIDTATGIRAFANKEIIY